MENYGKLPHFCRILFLYSELILHFGIKLGLDVLVSQCDI